MHVPSSLDSISSLLTTHQVAYLMADISNVNTSTIKDLYEALESLACMSFPSLLSPIYIRHAN